LIIGTPNASLLKAGSWGLCAAALGRKRHESIEDLTALRLGVRVDREGVVRRDFQTAQNVIRASTPREKWLKARAKGRTVGTQETVVSHRYYLADAAFLVGLEGERDLLEEIEAALRCPTFTLYLGRKGYVPAEPVFFPEGGLVDASLEEALALREPLLKDRADTPRYALEVSPEFNPGALGLTREVWDQPLGPFAERRFGPRLVWIASFPWGEVPHVP